MCRKTYNPSTPSEKLADGADKLVRGRHDRRVTRVMEGMHTRLRVDGTRLGPNGRAVGFVLIRLQDGESYQARRPGPHC